VNARTARAFLFIRHLALQYMNLSDYGSLRLRWNQEPCGPASLFCKTFDVYCFSFLVSPFPSSDMTFSARAISNLLACTVAETVPALLSPVHASPFAYISRPFCALPVSQLGGMNEKFASTYGTCGAVPPNSGPSWGLGTQAQHDHFQMGSRRREVLLEQAAPVAEFV
jgi:hypothetical protein